VAIDAGRVRAVGAHAELLATGWSVPTRCTPSWPPSSSWSPPTDPRRAPYLLEFELKDGRI
jgi:hypothetical protein